MEQTKDYSLLRPFDLEAAKRGEPIMVIDFSWPIIFCGTTTNGQVIFVEYTDKSGGDQEVANIRMAPLAWVEGKPVYKGDTLYKGTTECAITGVCEQDTEGLGKLIQVKDQGVQWANLLTWNKPKVKKSGWMNCYEHNENSVYPTKVRADLYALSSRTACIEIFWEE